MNCLFFRSLLVVLGLLWGAGAAGQGRGYEVVVSVVLGNSEAIKLDTASRLIQVGESDEVLAYTASTSTAEVRSLTQVEANGLSTKVLNYKDLKGTVVNLGSDLDNARLWLGSVSDGRAYVIVHSTGSEFKVLHNGQELLLSHRSLAKWIESKGLGSQEIVLLSCNDAATAQNLANKLPNAKIGSWSGEVRLFDNGFVEGDGTYKLYQKNTPPATITTPPNGGKTSKPQNGKMVRLGDEVVSGAFDDLYNQFNSFIGRKGLKHIFRGEINNVGKAVGVHHISAVRAGTAKIIPNTIEYLEDGFYRVSVEVSDGVGGWIAKEGKSTFFPDNWSEVKILQEIQSAKNNKIGNYLENTATKIDFHGLSSSGHRIRIIIDPRYGNSPGNILTSWFEPF
jgi:hypothetical protein